MKKNNLIFGTYNSIPVGTPSSVIEEIYKAAFKPFIQALNAYAEIRATLFYSGYLLEWLEQHHPEFIMLLNNLGRRKQIELLGGGYYDPVFPLLSNRDRMGQVELLTTYIRRRFGKRPRGCWLHGMYWEPDLTGNLKGNGMDFLFLDDYQFISAGTQPENRFLPCFTEDQGKVITIIPVASDYSRAVLFQGPEELFRCESGQKPETVNGAVTIMNDGLDYGYNEAHGNFFKEKRLENVFRFLVASRDMIETVLPSTFLKNTGPLPMLHFPSTNHREMREKYRSFFALPFGLRDTHDIGYIRQFLSGFPSYHYLYAKMLHVGLIINQFRGDRSRKKSALADLWKGQSGFDTENPAVFLPAGTRRAAYKAFIEAEKSLHEETVFSPSLSSYDFDMDGLEEYIFQGTYYNLYIHSRNGRIFELDYLTHPWNYIEMVPHSEKKKNGVLYGTRNGARHSFIERFYLHNTNFDEYRKDKCKELTHSFDKVYTLHRIDKEQKEITFGYSFMSSKEGNGSIITLKKTYRFLKRFFQVIYNIGTVSERRIKFLFGTEINLSVFSGTRKLEIMTQAGGVYENINGGHSQANGVEELIINHAVNKTKITLTPSLACRLWSHRIACGEDDSRTDIRNFVPVWPVEISHDRGWEVKMTMKFDKIGKSPQT